MDFANRGNRPVQPQQQPTQSNEPMMTQMPQKNSNNKGSSLGKVSSLIMLFGIALLAASLILILVFGGKGSVRKESNLIVADKYQAVFLDSQDGQVYFGKLNVYNDNLYLLSDIYYVRVEQKIQPEGAATNDPQQSISLAKLGNELHGPEDFMFIARDKVLYWENLKDDGQVVKAITDYKATGGASAETTTQTPAASETTETEKATTEETPGN